MIRQVTITAAEVMILQATSSGMTTAEMMTSLRTLSAALSTRGTREWMLPTLRKRQRHIVPGCTELQQGITAVDLSGSLQWCDSISGVSRAIVTPNGDALVHDFGILYDYNRDGSRDWSFTFPFPSGTLIGPSVGPDGTIYIFHSRTFGH